MKGPQPAMLPPGRAASWDMDLGALLLAGFLSLAAQGMPQFSERAGRRGPWAMGNLGAIRSALSIYYGDMNGQYPSDLGALTVGGKYLPTIPRATVPEHPESSLITRYGREVCPRGSGPDHRRIRDTGGWGYVSASKSPCDGIVFIDCSHLDRRRRDFEKARRWVDY